MANRPLRVAWDNSLARRNPTGGGVYATQLIRELQANPGVELKLFEGWDAKRRPGEFGSQSILARAKRGLNGLFWSHTYFPYMVRKENFDVVHSPAFVVPFICPCPSVVTFYDITHLKFPEDFEARWRNYLNFVLPMSLRRASAIICISEHTRKDLLAHYKVAEDKLHVIYCGVDTARFHEGVSLDREWASSLGLRPGYLLHVGAFSRRKNIPMLLRAVASLKAKESSRTVSWCSRGLSSPSWQERRRFARGYENWAFKTPSYSPAIFPITRSQDFTPEQVSWCFHRSMKALGCQYWKVWRWEHL
jgi:glycosyltransferase involved in cell wall biosynthesis